MTDMVIEGKNMANGLLDMFMPSEDEALRRAMMAAGFGMMGTRRGQEAAGFGRAGLLGMGVYENSLRNQLQNKAGQFDLASGVAKMQGEQQAAKQQQEAFAALAGMPSGPASIAGPPAAFQQPGGASALMSGAASGMTPPATQLATQMAAPPDDPSAQKMAQANYLEDMFRKTGNPTMFLMAQKLRKEAMEMRDENQGFETVMGPDGTPKIVQRRKFGAPQEMPYAPKPEIKTVAAGNRAEFYDALRPPTSPIMFGQSPDSKASVGATIRGQDLVNARARDANAITQGNAGQARATDLRKEFNALPQVKAYGEVQPVLQSAREAVGIDTAAADLNLIYAAAKIMDPTSVVRESETSMVVASGSPAQRFAGQFNYVAGGGRLTKGARQQLMQQIESRGRGYEAGYNSARTSYEGVAKKQGVDPADVFVEPFARSAAGQSAAQVVSTLPATAPEGTVATDNATGKQLVFSNGRWVPK